MKKPERPPRKRNKSATHQRLLAAAARVFNRDGYFGTDSNKLARAAGLAAGTFYQHFSDKRDCFLRVYEAWVDAEWSQLARIVEGGSAPAARARAIVDAVVDMHKQWRGLRAGLRALAASDDEVRRAQRAERRRQLELIVELRSEMGAPPRSRADDALLLYSMERAADALADGETTALDVEEPALRASLHKLVLSHLAGSPAKRSLRRPSRGVSSKT